MLEIRDKVKVPGLTKYGRIVAIDRGEGRREPECIVEYHFDDGSEGGVRRVSKWIKMLRCDLIVEEKKDEPKEDEKDEDKR